MYPHRIRLRGPWQCQPLAHLARQPNGKTETIEPCLPPACTMIMPCGWGEGGLGDFAGRVRFGRRFGAPRQTDSCERVWLTFAGVETRADVWLNQQFLGHQEGAGEPFEFDVTRILQKRNLLVVEVESADRNGGLCGEVALEVRCEVFLKDVRMRTTWNRERARLHVAGRLAGETDLPLELYVVLDRFTIAYQAVKPGNKSFELSSEELPPERWQSETADSRHLVRVELVQAAVSWYTVEQAFTFDV